MQALYSIEDLEALISKYEDEGGEVYRLGDESLGLGTVILTAPEELHLYSFIIKEVYLNEWSSGHTLRKYKKLPKCYLQMVDKLLQEEESISQFMHFAGGVYE